MEEKNNKGYKGLIIIIILLLIVIIGLVGYIYLKMKNETNNNTVEITNITNSTIKENEEIKVTEEDVDSLFKLFVENDNYGNHINGAIDILNSEKDTILFSDLNEKDKLNIVLKDIDIKEYNLVDANGGKYGAGEYTIDSNKLKESYKLYFDSEMDLPQSYSKDLMDCNLNDSEYICDVIIGGIEGDPEGYDYFRTNYTINNNVLNIQGFIAYYNFLDMYYMDDDKGGYKYSNEGSFYCNNIKDKEEIKECLIENGFDNYNKVDIEFDLSTGKTIFKKISIENKFVA